jgi:hypothetical protein
MEISIALTVIFTVVGTLGVGLGILFVKLIPPRIEASKRRGKLLKEIKEKVEIMEKNLSGVGYADTLKQLAQDILMSKEARQYLKELLETSQNYNDMLTITLPRVEKVVSEGFRKRLKDIKDYEKNALYKCIGYEKEDKVDISDTIYRWLSNSGADHNIIKCLLEEKELDSEWFKKDTIQSISIETRDELKRLIENAGISFKGLLGRIGDNLKYDPSMRFLMVYRERAMETAKRFKENLEKDRKRSLSWIGFLYKTDEEALEKVENYINPKIKTL